MSIISVFSQPKANQTHYSQKEAAEQLGISIEQLQKLVLKYITRDEEMAEDTTLRASDIVILRFLSAAAPKAASAVA